MAARKSRETAECRQTLEELIRLTCPGRANELSNRLVDRFGSLGDAVAARTADRTAILDGVPEVERTIQCLRKAMNHILHGRIQQRRVMSNERALLEYLRQAMAFEPIEQFRVIFLNAANEMLADEILGIGTVSRVHLYPREVMKRCLEIGATAIILVHNHPAGTAEPSRADRNLTRQMMAAAQPLGITVHDHLVICRDGYVSFRKAGLM